MVVEKHKIDSSFIDSVGYDLSEKKLRVWLLNGHTYDYFDVPEEEFERLLEAESAGEYYNRKIKGTYEFNEIKYAR